MGGWIGVRALPIVLVVLYGQKDRVAAQPVIGCCRETMWLDSGAMVRN